MPREPTLSPVKLRSPETRSMRGMPAGNSVFPEKVRRPARLASRLWRSGMLSFSARRIGPLPFR